jgi:hypothetical protein
MATMREQCATDEQRSFVQFLWVKGLRVKDIHEEIFPVFGGKCLSQKALHNWVEKFSQGLSKIADGTRPGEVVAETTTKRPLCCGL